MRSGFYIKTAWNNIRKNYRFYIPQILTGMGLLACLYIVYTLRSDERIITIPGGDYMPTFMNIGTVIICLLSVILILYTNSFLMRQRKREYGLYNVLGMESGISPGSCSGKRPSAAAAPCFLEAVWECFFIRSAPFSSAPFFKRISFSALIF